MFHNLRQRIKENIGNGLAQFVANIRLSDDVIKMSAWMGYGSCTSIRSGEQDKLIEKCLKDQHKSYKMFSKNYKKFNFYSLLARIAGVPKEEISSLKPLISDTIEDYGCERNPSVLVKKFEDFYHTMFDNLHKEKPYLFGLVY